MPGGYEPKAAAAGRRSGTGHRPEPVGALFAQLPSGGHHGAQRGEREGAADRHACHAEGGELGYGRGRREREDVHGTIDGGEQPAEVVDGRDPGRVEHVGPRRLVGLQAGDGVVEVGPAVQVVLAASGQHERPLGPGRIDGRLDAGPRRAEVVDRVGRVGREVLDGAAGEPGGGGPGNRPGDVLGGGAEAVLEVGRDRQVDGGHDGGGVVERLVARDRAVGTAEGGGEAVAGRREGVEAERRQQLGRAGIPRVGEEQRRGASMEGEEARRFLVPCRHGPDVNRTCGCRRRPFPWPGGGRRRGTDRRAGPGSRRGRGGGAGRCASASCGSVRTP